MRISPKNKVIVARNGEEWKEIVKFKREDDILVTSKKFYWGSCYIKRRI